MRVNDLAVADVIYSEENNIPSEIASLHRPLKYLRIKIGQSFFNLKIDEVKEKEIILTPYVSLEMDIKGCKYVNKKGEWVDFDTLTKDIDYGSG